MPDHRNRAQRLTVTGGARDAEQLPPTKMQPLSRPIRLQTSPPRPASDMAWGMARRAATLSMDALLILVFSPVILAWLLVGRRKRGAPET